MKKYTISLGEKIRFGFSDIGINLAFYMITSYFMLYLTDVVGLPSKIVGTIFLIAMLFDAVNDPIMDDCSGHSILHCNGALLCKGPIWNQRENCVVSHYVLPVYRAGDMLRNAPGGAAHGHDRRPG